ncbi:serine/threonine-protein kinase [Nocardia cyriacigeorgica]|uniref:serine/threonine-protein kinase n=1 Tax=Nocardia cyriacigeorgica TaxID=135487 RepID=UPI00280375CE|nr:serine/threonine-protein kinase [Nocardia cyriacigeorgica]
MEIAEGMDFAGYRIERRLGVGGMGAVYLVQHPRLPRKDALKVLADSHRDDPEFRARFLREADIAARLQHPNLVAVRDRGEFDGRLWLTMQYIDGVDGAQLIRRGPAALPLPRAVYIVAEAARGLDEIHRAGLLHRDVKPANILIAEQPGEPDRVLVTDFGIARPADDSTTLGDPGGLTASLAYAAPEQLRGEVLDQRADVYALGCTLFHLLTGSVPFQRDTAGAVMFAHLNDPPPRPSQVDPRLPAGFDNVIATALAKDPARRYPSCGALAEAAHRALTEADAETVRLHPSTAAVPVPAGAPPVRKSGARALLWAGAAAVAVLAVVIAVAAWPARVESASAVRLPTPSGPAPKVSADWAAYAFMVEPFAELLPYSPDGYGYRELTICQAIDERRDLVRLDTALPVSVIRCTGDQDPVAMFFLHCNADRTRVGPLPWPGTEGEEYWERPSGSGYLRWGSYTTVHGEKYGRLEVFFDDPDRNFCAIQVNGEVAAAELRARWWFDAPL